MELSKDILAHALDDFKIDKVWLLEQLKITKIARKTTKYNPIYEDIFDFLDIVSILEMKRISTCIYKKEKVCLDEIIYDYENLLWRFNFDKRLLFTLGGEEFVESPFYNKLKEEDFFEFIDEAFTQILWFLLDKYYKKTIYNLLQHYNSHNDLLIQIIKDQYFYKEYKKDFEKSSNDVNPSNAKLYSWALSGFRLDGEA